MIWWIASGAVVYVIVPLMRPLFQAKMGKNYLGELVPSGLGSAFIIPSVLVMIFRASSFEHSLLFALTALFFSLLGGIDDYVGDSEKRGFRGHFSELRLSTGMLKAVGGASGAIALGTLLGGSWLDALLDGFVIALSANFINLLDTRPGRAGKGFILLGLPLYLLHPNQLAPLFALLWAVLGYLPWDLKRHVMMGDTGSNPLGAVLGLAAVLVLSGPFKILLLLILLGLNIASEKISFTQVIESNRILHFVDQLGQEES